MRGTPALSSAFRMPHAARPVARSRGISHGGTPHGVLTASYLSFISQLHISVRTGVQLGSYRWDLMVRRLRLMRRTALTGLRLTGGERVGRPRKRELNP